MSSQEETPESSLCTHVSIGSSWGQALTRLWVGQHLDRGAPAYRTMSKECLLLKASRSVGVLLVGPADSGDTLGS